MLSEPSTHYSEITVFGGVFSCVVQRLNFAEQIPEPPPHSHRLLTALPQPPVLPANPLGSFSYLSSNVTISENHSSDAPIVYHKFHLAFAILHSLA